MGYDTAQNIIADAAVQLSLPAVTDAFGSQDANVIQLRSLLRSVGRDLRRARAWTHLSKSWAFTTSLNVGRYSLPPDYGRFIPNTAWNRTNRLPVPGPLTPQEFQALKARLVGVVYNVLFRQLQGQFQAFPDTTTPASYVIAFEYTSAYWVTPSGTHASSGTWQNATAYTSGQYFENGGRLYTCTQSGTSGNTGPTGTGTGITDGTCKWDYVSAAGADDVTANADAILFDSHLVVRALKASWQRAKGLDSTAAEQDLEEALQAAFDDDSPGRTLAITGSPFDEPMLSTRNLPVTGFGGGT